jgi:aldehyde:ferredoxin oxidoreductase
MTKVGGWTGKILRVNLTTGNISTVDTMKYKDYVGGMGIGYKVMFDEVPVGTKAYDEKNKIIFGAGPLTGSGVPCSSRTNITSLLPTNPFHGVSDSHMGGNFAAVMKYAGWDAIIVEGASQKPVWLRIEDSKVTLEDASFVWGTGIYNTTAKINGVFGQEAVVAAIGQAGENLVNMAVIMNGRCHSAGGHGSVMGSKKLKAIAVKGTGSVHMAGSKEEFLKLDDYMMKELLGANNNHSVPTTPQPWAEYHGATRWTARKGLYWGAAETPVETGECPPGDKNKVGLRTMKAVFDMGEIAAKYTVRQGGCQSCPIRCMPNLKIPQLEKYGVSPYVENTCSGLGSPSSIMIFGAKDQFEKGDNTMIPKALGSQLADDYGVWCNYGNIARDFSYAYTSGIIKKVLPKEEYDSIPWDLLEAGDPAFLIDFYKRVALKIGEFSHIGDGTYWIAKRWNFGEDFWKNSKYLTFSPLGFPKHHSNEEGAQTGSIISCLFNRDAQSHSHSNFLRNGLPIKVQKQLAKDLWGSEDAVDAKNDYTPMNIYKAKFAKWAIIRNCLHDSLTLCNWMWPMTVSPNPKRNYKGDTSMESKYMTLVTGIPYSEEELDLAGERILTLHRALTVKQMGTTDMRGKHDIICDWVFDKDPDKKPFTPGTDKMDREDMKLAMTMFYKEMGWDEKLGCPTKETLEKLGMKDVADELGKLNLLP